MRKEWSVNSPAALPCRFNRHCEWSRYRSKWRRPRRPLSPRRTTPRFPHDASVSTEACRKTRLRFGHVTLSRRFGPMDQARAGQKTSSLPLLHPEVEAVDAPSSPISRLGVRQTNTTGQAVKDVVTSGEEDKETTRTKASRDGKRPNGHKPASNKN